MKNSFTIILLCLSLIGAEALAGNCILNTSTPVKTQATLTCLQNRISTLERVKPLAKPVTVYNDNFVAIELIGKSRGSFSAAYGWPIKLALRIRNKSTTKRLLIGYLRTNDGPLLTDDFAIADSLSSYCSGCVSGIADVSALYSTPPFSTDPTNYTAVGKGASRTFTLNFSNSFKGKYFDLNMDMARYDEDLYESSSFMLPWENIQIP